MLKIVRWIFPFRFHFRTQSKFLGGYSKEETLTSDFSAARIHLERAFHSLRGSDEISQKACEALDLLVDAVIKAETKRSSCKILAFPNPMLLDTIL